MFPHKTLEALTFKNNLKEKGVGKVEADKVQSLNAMC